MYSKLILAIVIASSPLSLSSAICEDATNIELNQKSKRGIAIPYEDDSGSIVIIFPGKPQIEETEDNLFEATYFSGRKEWSLSFAQGNPKDLFFFGGDFQRRTPSICFVSQRDSIVHFACLLIIQSFPFRSLLK